jgi:hypothetical protein
MSATPGSRAIRTTGASHDVLTHMAEATVEWGRRRIRKDSGGAGWTRT